MQKQHALVPAGFAALVTAALANQPAAAVTQVVAPQAAASPAQTATATARASDDDDRIDAFDVLAASLGVDISEQGLIRRTRASLRQLRADQDASSRTRSTAFLRAFFALPLRTTAPGLADARKALDAIDPSRSDRPIPASDQLFDGNATTIERFIAGYFNRDVLTLSQAPAGAVLLANDFRTLNRRALELEMLKQAADQQRINVHFLIATLPDPIDSFTGWQFDPMLDAITQAITTDEYVLDRSHFPDVDEELEPSAHAAASSHAHDIEPGVVIFRRRTLVPTSSPDAHADRLVLLTVHENPAAGVHDRALANAIRLVASWPLPAGGKGEIRILGPTFSGSSESIARALRMSRRPLARQGFRVRVVSGSATDALNQDVIEAALPEDGLVTFQATVQPDTELIPALFAHVRDAGWRGRVAVLFEANTQYGRQVGELMDRTLRTSKELSILRLPFPMNISRLRTTAPATTEPEKGSFSAPSKFRHLEMEAPRSATDQIHQFHPETTATYMELALSDLLDTIDRERIGTVALLATDPRDKLFLAQQIARYSPDVSIVTAESDSIYTHPDYASYLHGALVVSSYPLWSDNQRLTYGFKGGEERRQFANGSAQGIYNAVLALLDYTADGKPLPRLKAYGETPPLLEYGPPLQSCAACAPAIWISTIGYSRPWVVRATTPDGHESRPYVFHVRRVPSSPAPSVSSQPLGPAVFAALCAVLVVGTLAHLLGLRFVPVLAGVAARREQASGYHVAALLGVAALHVLALALAAASWRANGPEVSVVTASLALAVSLVAQVVLSVPLVKQTVRAGSRAWRERRTSMHAASLAATGFAVAGLALWAIASFVVYAVHHAREPRADSLGFLARTLDLGSGVSPAVPLLLLLAGFVVWAFVERARTLRPPVALASRDCEPLLAQAVNGDVTKMVAGWKYLNQSLLALPPRLLAVAAVPLIVTIVSTCDPFVRPLVTIEGRAYGRAITAVLLGLQLLVTLALLQYVHLWSRLRALLRAMAWHPMADAYERVPRRLFPSGVLPRTPRLMELETLVTQWQRCATSGSWARVNAAALLSHRPALRTTFEHEMKVYPGEPWSGSKTWTSIADAHPEGARSPAATPPLRPVAATAGGRVRSPFAVGAAPAAAPVPAVLPAPSAAHQTLIAMAMALVVRDGLARLNYNAAFVAIGTLILSRSQTLFPFQVHQRLAILGWSYLGVAFLTILVALLQMKRNEIIARLASPARGEVAHWDIALVLKVAMLVIVPLATIFAAQFPSLGGTILHWLEPVQKALP